MTDLSLVPAGAGAGKTFHIQKRLADWVEAGTVAPGRILAVTFTEAAASELRERVRAELMARSRIADALDLDHAYMGTIHALGQRLLTEHAFAAARAPRARLLSEPERDLLIRRAMTQCAALAPLMQDLTRFGYRWDHVTKTGAEDAFRARLLSTVDLIRGLGVRATDPAILDPALAALRAGYGTPASDGDALTAALRRAVAALLDAFPDSLAPLFEGNKSARESFAGNHRDLRRAARPGTLDRDWALWQNLRDLRLSKRGAPTPEGYDALAAAVMAAADALPRHPGPLADAEAHLTALVTGAQQVLAAYDAAKKRAGLIDYTDMIVETEALLRTRPEIRDAVTAEIDCVVIDEFQDTNPVQFALLWRLAQGAPRALIVGDTKQSVMGFQGADPRLTAALQDAHPDAVAPLDRNRRSDPRIMGFVNALGPALFPGSYQPLAPQREASDAPALEAIDLPSRSGLMPDCVANHVADLLASGAEVRDKATGAMRSARPADIAVLCYTHDKCGAVAAALEARGLPVRIRQPGWLTSPAMRAARAALAYAADPSDQLAALTYATLGPPAMPLREALAGEVDGTLDALDALEALRPFNALSDIRPVAETVTAVLCATGLRDWAAGLADPGQAVADLARLEAEAQEFDAAEAGLRAAADFHGCGLPVFLGWVAGQTDRGWDRHPDPDGWSGTGVAVVTWHSAKGLEWPITVVAGLDQKIAARRGTLSAEFARFDDLGDVLAHAGLSWLPSFAAPESQAAFAHDLRPKDERAAARALYVALTRARDRLILALPPEKKEREETERMVDLLRDHAGLMLGEDAIRLGDAAFPARIIPGDPEPVAPIVLEAAVLPAFGTPREARSSPRTPWRRSPSTLVADTAPPTHGLTTEPFGPAIAETRTATATDRGTAWHHALRVALARPDLVDRLPAATGLSPATCEQIAAQAEALKAWLEARGFDRLHVELPLQNAAPDGSETNAILDLLAEGPAGMLIVDHKSGPCPDPAARFPTYRPQLDAYAALVRARWPVKPLHGVAINWMSEGTVTLHPADAEQPA
jgi:ATP-dependent exoDNAse (exonuclease V) beta subunit